MKTLFTTIAAVAFSATAFAGGPLSEQDTYGSILFDQNAGSSGNYSEPTGAVADAMRSSDSFGSVLYDLNRTSNERPTQANPPAIGDNTDDYGNVLYDLGARY